MAFSKLGLGVLQGGKATLQHTNSSSFPPERWEASLTKLVKRSHGARLSDFKKALDFACRPLDKSTIWYTISTMIQLYNETLIQYGL